MCRILRAGDCLAGVAWLSENWIRGSGGGLGMMPGYLAALVQFCVCVCVCVCVCEEGGKSMH